MTTHLASTAQFVADRGWGMMDHRDGRFGGHPLLGLLCMALFVGAVVALLMWAFGRGRVGHPAHASHAAPAASPTASAEAILAERLARGEVTPDDYRSLLAALRGTPPPTAP